MALRNAPTGLMSSLGYGKGYQHAHGYQEAVTDMDCLPPALSGRRFYQPAEVGFEKTIRQLMDHREELRRKRGVQKKSNQE